MKLVVSALSFWRLWEQSGARGQRSALRGQWVHLLLLCPVKQRHSRVWTCALLFIRGWRGLRDQRQSKKGKNWASEASWKQEEPFAPYSADSWFQNRLGLEPPLRAKSQLTTKAGFLDKHNPLPQQRETGGRNGAGCFTAAS